ncbi:MAG: DsrH/TusB family sulfur metabolism protein [Candidatus Thorarchaeota archaeon]|nr:DsrH/TusB family sulfur metabolism protein [Candidatus Thorarchaeota archaeon]
MKFLIWLSTECGTLNEVISALKSQGNEVGVLLVQDGVFLTDKGCPHAQDMIDLKVPMYALKAHAEERGIMDRMIGDAKLVEYPEIVDIMMEQYDKIISM